ncbi:ribonuclease 3-like protein 2 isoform X3 [Hordeum vulgare subsp. vulgare]|uniref:ribonuclease 3-like protein 2 isoform X3 n=1 Tax=Hordeum vulgare subsp. vulgare TaxID=112509 RepID=UPI001D1A411B|nr:ribonuclease 3-like protein 2 isoform X3 [Hordeum vulgare subsp. vulgare]
MATRAAPARQPPASRKRRASPPALSAPVTLPPPGFVADRAEAAARVERLLQYRFRDRSLLDEALTHQSFSGGAGGAASYQRLEFVGDAALGLAFSNFLYLTNPTVGPGALSTLRAANISTEKLARVAVRHDLYPLLRRNCPRLDLLVTRFLFEPIVTAETIDEQPVSTLHELCQKHGKDIKFKSWQKGGTTVVNVFVGGVLVGTGSSEQMGIAKLNATRDALSKLHGGGNQQVLTTGVGHGLGVEVGELRECKKKLIDQCNRKLWPKPIFKLEKEDGPAHDRTFVYSVQVETQGGIWLTLGDRMSRVKDAENSGAQKMLEHLLKL